MARARAIVGGMATASLLACNLLSGVGDLEVTDDAGVVGAPDARVDSRGAVDASLADGQGLIDAKAPIDTGPPPTCPSAGHSCVKGPPENWFGPFLTYVGAENGAPGCPTELPEADDHATGAPAAAFECECRCGRVDNAQCKAFLQGYTDGVCTPPVASPDLDLGTCQTPDLPSGFLATLQATGGSCIANAQFKKRDQPQFTTLLRTCGRPTPFSADGCGAEELCVPDGVAPFKPHTCIFSEDEDATCPAPWTERLQLFDDIEDTRACNKGTCSCGAPNGVQCSGRMRNYTTAKDCTGDSTNVQLPVNACIAVTETTSQRVVPQSLGANGGACPPSGAPAPGGGVKGTGGSTVCCVP